MVIHILSLFPNMFKGPFDESMVKRAIDKGLIEIVFHNLRDYATDSHKSVDSRAYGGGKGMVLRVDVMDLAIKDIKKRYGEMRVYAMSPQGNMFSQTKAKELSKEDSLLLIAGHYEGFDERIIEHLIDEEISIGNYILTGGELPAMVIIDTLTRLIPGVLDTETTENESFSNGNTLDYPTYTQPAEYKGWSVPEILRGGNHKEIREWRSKKSKMKLKQ